MKIYWAENDQQMTIDWCFLLATTVITAITILITQDNKGVTLMPENLLHKQMKMKEIIKLRFWKYCRLIVYLQ